MALLLAFLVITLRANQIVSGLALTIFAGAAGLSSYLGNDLGLADAPADAPVRLARPLRARRPADPRADPLRADVARLRLVGVRARASALYLARTRPGLNVRAVGESPQTADAMGISVTAYRYAHTRRRRRPRRASAAPASASPSRRSGWTGLTGGAGWIAIALVIFAFWRPELCLVGAYFFGAFPALPFTAPGARRLTIAPELFQALPYVMTVVVLVIVSSGIAKRRLGAPAALGIPFVREER